VDIGAYEYQGPGSLISYAWLQQYGLPTDGSADFLPMRMGGTENDNWQEWRCWTCPHQPASSALRLLSSITAHRVRQSDLSGRDRQRDVIGRRVKSD